jgi:hypothetical protein
VFERFSHYVSYGATDQQTVRALAGSIDGLVVPGTVAAFQRLGTGGFVLTLSATHAAPDYVIDPRFPLFQQSLPSAKASHRALAELLGFPELVSEATLPAPAFFTDDRIEGIAGNWLQFNRGYSTDVAAKFDKYAQRLGEPVELPDAKPPLFVLPPYASCEGTTDPWWLVSRRLFEASQRQAQDAVCVRVVASKDVRFLGELLTGVDGDERVVVWVSGLQELEYSDDSLEAYGRALAEASKRGQDTFALYGGFFSVLLASVGLAGSSHGIGYGEYRDWIELPQSGPPPARYYLRQLHRYVSQEMAYQIWLRDRALVECRCQECQGAPPVALDYHALMKHSVLCRQEEIQSWSDLTAGEMADRLDQEFRLFWSELAAISLPSFIERQAENAADHIPRWISAMRRLA